MWYLHKCLALLEGSLWTLTAMGFLSLGLNIECVCLVTLPLNKTKVFYIIKRKEQDKAGWG